MSKEKTVMIPGRLLPMQHSKSLANMQCNHGLRNGRFDGGATFMYMGPVAAAVILYVAERLVSRLFAGQLLRKGVPRKMRRLKGMLTEVHVIHAVALDIIDDISS